MTKCSCVVLSICGAISVNFSTPINSPYNDRLIVALKRLRKTHKRRFPWRNIWWIGNLGDFVLCRKSVKRGQKQRFLLSIGSNLLLDNQREHQMVTEGTLRTTNSSTTYAMVMGRAQSSSQDSLVGDEMLMTSDDMSQKNLCTILILNGHYKSNPVEVNKSYPVCEGWSSRVTRPESITNSKRKLVEDETELARTAEGTVFGRYYWNQTRSSIIAILRVR